MIRTAFKVVFRGVSCNKCGKRFRIQGKTPTEVEAIMAAHKLTCGKRD